MSLKTFTALCLALAFGATLAWGGLFAARPLRSAPVQERRVSAQRLLGATFVGLLSLLGAGVGSVLILRAAREEYRLASRRNLESLVSGVRADKGAKDDL